MTLAGSAVDQDSPLSAIPVSFLQGCVEWGLFLDRATLEGTAYPVL